MKIILERQDLYFTSRRKRKPDIEDFCLPRSLYHKVSFIGYEYKDKLIVLKNRYGCIKKGKK